MAYQKNNKKERVDLYETCTNTILDMIDQGVIPWQNPWLACSTGGAVSHVTGKSYSFLNQMLLGGQKGEYATFKQIQKEGGKVKKGARARQIMFWQMIKKTWTKENENADDSTPLFSAIKEKTEYVSFIPVLRYYNVFNIEDAEGIVAKFGEDKLPEAVNSDEKAEAIINAYIQRANLPLYREETSNRAFYSLLKDEVTVPNRRQYTDQGEYYSTLFHELTHSTGKTSRLNRFNLLDWDGFGSLEYAREELVAEIGAFFLCSYCGIDTESTVKNSVAYLRGGRDRIAKDKKLIVIAASRAQKAVEFILGEKFDGEASEENENAA